MAAYARRMSEIELKFGVDAARAAAIDAALRRLPSKRSAIESRYVDSDDFRLASAGLSLRLRRSGRAWEQTLKASTDQAAERLEETVPRPGRWGREVPPVDSSLHDGTPAGKRLRAALGGAPLVVVCTSRVVRRSVEIATADGCVELAFDRGTISAGAASAPVCELEYELKQGDPRLLVELGRAAVRVHGAWLSTLSKSARGARLARGESESPAVKAAPPRLDRALSGAAIFRAVLRACLDQVLANASEVAAGQRDAELIHQLRVGLRRMRVAWRELAPLASASADDAGWQPPCAEAFRALGDYRDRSTVIATLRSRLAAAGSPEPSLRPPDAAPPEPVEVVRDKDFQCALLALMALTFEAPAHAGVETRVESAADHGVPGESKPIDRIRSRLGKLRRRLVADALSFETQPHDAQHRIRKRLKRLRYLAELVASLYAPSRVERYLAALRPAQDALGTHIDLIVGLGLAQDAARRGDARAWFNVGWLTAELATSGRRCRKALAHAAKARPFWKR